MRNKSFLAGRMKLTRKKVLCRAPGDFHRSDLREYSYKQRAMEKSAKEEPRSSAPMNARGRRSPSREEELPFDIRGGVHSDTSSYFDMSRTAIKVGNRRASPPRNPPHKTRPREMIRTLLSVNKVIRRTRSAHTSLFIFRLSFPVGR